jgi:paraquat-inducible protein B
MSSPDSPAPSGGRALLIWVVPVVALLASAWLLHREFRSRGPLITIDFANGAGLQAGKTPLLHKGVTVGLVQDVALKPALDGVRVRVELDPSAAPLATEGAEFWLVHPEVSLSGVRGLDTLLSGARIHARPGRGPATARFTALAKAPMEEADQPGTSYVLRSAKLGSLHPGSGVYYREVKVGVVEQHRLAPDATHVLVSVKVFAPYDRLVHLDTRFWNSGGFTMKVGLLGANLHTNSLESLVAGGVSFATPDRDRPEAMGRAPEGTVFDLQDDGDKAWLKWSPRIDLGPPGG